MSVMNATYVYVIGTLRTRYVSIMNATYVYVIGTLE